MLESITQTLRALAAHRQSPQPAAPWASAGVLGVLVLLLCSSTVALAAGNRLEALSYSALPGNRLEIRMTLAQPSAEPVTFTIDEPARLALDFADTANELPRKTQTIGMGVARSISAVEARGRTRVVLNLVRLVPYNVRIDGNDVVLTLDASSGAAPVSAAAATRAAAVEGHRVEDVDFRRGAQGEGRIVITLSDAGVAVDVRQEGDRIVVDFLDSALPGALERRLDVVDFATPVKIVDTFAVGRNVRMNIEPLTSEFEHLAYQSDNVFTLDIKPVSKEEQERLKKEKFGYVGEKLSLNFQNIEVRAVLQLLADFAGFNLVTSDTVTGTVTLRLKNVPWDQALDIILKTKGLAKRQNGNVMLVAPTEEIASREKLELEAQKQLQELKPLKSDIIQVNYAKATDIAELLLAGRSTGAEGGGALTALSPRGSVLPDQRTNTLLIQDTSDKIEEVRQLVSVLDIPVRQVLIESRIVVANTDFGKDLGVRWGFTRDDSGIPSSPGNPAVITGNLSGVTELLNDSALSLNNSLAVNLPAAPVGASAASIGLAIAKLPLGTLLQLELSALEQENRGEVISNPRVITANGKEALIEKGTEIPYLEAASSGAATVSFKKAVLSLKVTPQVTPDNNIVMDLVVTEDTVGETIQLLGSNVPSIDTQEVSTRVLVENGETVVLGGVYKQESRETVNRVPFLGDLPAIGALFRQKSLTNDKNELLIFVTPKVLDEKLGSTRVTTNR